MNRADLADGLRGIICRITGYDSVIELDAPFLELTSMSSLQTVQMTVSLDTDYGVKFGMEPEDFEALESLDRLVDLVSRKATKGI